MLAVGLGIALVARVAARDAYVRAHAGVSLRFQAIVVAIVAALAAVGLVAVVVGGTQPDGEPTNLLGVMSLGAVAFGLAVPAVELARATFGLAGLRRSQ